MANQSRNVWIKKDDPKLVSAKHKDIFTDMLEDRRNSSDLKFVLRSRDVPKFKLNKPRSNDELKGHVLNSDRVRYAIDQVVNETQLPSSVVRDQAMEIIEEMAHMFKMSAVRGFAFALVKVLKQLFKRVYVNEEGLQKVRSTMEEYPILLVPNHRSYIDFLLCSYIFYSFDLPMPVIASAMDFMGMKFVGWLLRSSGAFYIRRSFGDDQLYWAIFTEYVQTQICNGDSPIEFYVEGTRSRTAKSYPPKFGMLSAALEPYFKSHIPDIMVIPVSISYDRILEENLYAFELLGVPKPKESTSGLLKARSVLDDDFGNVHMYFGEPISIRQYADGKVDRSAHNLAPRYIASLTSEESRLLQVFGHSIILTHQKNMVISPWSFISAILMQSPSGICIRDLIREVDWLKRQALNLGAQVDWPVHENADTIIRAHLSLHKNIVDVSPDDVVSLSHVTVSQVRGQDELMLNSARHLMLSLYRNQLMHVFVRVGLICISINSCGESKLSVDTLFEEYSFLESLLKFDFIFLPGNTKVDFDHALATLIRTCGVVVDDQHVFIDKSTNKFTTFFSHMFEPFILGYWVMCQYLLTMNPGINGKPLARPPKVLTREAQLLGAKLLREGVIKHYEVLSLDMMTNALNSLFRLGAVRKEKRDGVVYKFPEAIPLSKISDKIGGFIDTPPLPAVSIDVDSKTVTVNAKL